MYRFLSLFSCIVACNAFASAQAGQIPQDLSTSVIYQKVLPSIVTIKTDCGDGQGELGTGFFAMKDNLIVTAFHVIANAKKATARFSDGEEFDVEGIVDFDHATDLAVLRIKAPSHPMLGINSQDPTIGGKACAVGAPLGLEFTVSDGIVSQIQVISGKKQIQYSCPTSPGNSGGPLLNGQGEVIGIVDWQFVDGENLNFAVPISYISALNFNHSIRPWSDDVEASEKGGISPSSGGAGSPTILSEAELKSRLAHAMTVQFDANLAYWELWQMGAISRSYEHGVPTTVLVAEKRLTDEVNNSLVRFKGAPGDGASAWGEMSYVLHETDKALRKLMDAMDQAEAADEWSSSAKYTSRESAAMWRTLPETPTVKKLTSDPVFQALLPHMYLVESATILDPCHFKFGAQSYLQDPLYLATVTKKSLADKLHFRPFERIEQFDGKEPKDLEELKAMIEIAAGKKVKVRSHVSYNGKERDWEVDVPKNLTNP
jgi:hypothetical protein